MSDPAPRPRCPLGAARERGLAAGAWFAGAAAWLALLFLVGLCAVRLECLVLHEPCLAAHGERIWLSWAYRHPDPEEVLRQIGAQLRPGEPVAIVARQAEQEAYWWSVMTAYFLPGHRLAGVRNLRRGPGPALPGVAQAIVHWHGRRLLILRPPGC